MANTLKDFQKELNDTADRVLKMQLEQDQLQRKIRKAQDEHKSEKDIAKLIKESADQFKKINLNINKQSELQESLKQRHAELRAKIDTIPPLSPKELQKAKNEIGDYDAFRSEIRAKQEKIQAEERAKKEKIYQQEKKKILESLGDLLSDPKGLRDILNPLAAKSRDKKEEGLGFGAKFKAGMGAVAFAASHASSVASIIGSRGFYSAEAKKMARIINQEEQYDPQNPPFFMRLLKDPQILEFLHAQGPKVLNLVEVVAPLVAPIILKELGKVDAIEKELQDKAKALAALPEKEAELANLKKGDLEGSNKRIEELQQEITPLKDLQNRAKIARAIKNLKARGLGDDFINAQLLPIVTETIRELLAKPQDLIDIASAGIDFAIAPEQAIDDKKAALEKIFEKIDINRLLQNGKLAEFLSSQSVALTEVVATAMDASPEVSAKMAEMGIGREAVAGVVEALAPIAGEMLRAPDAGVIGRIKGAVANIALNDLEQQKRGGQSSEESKDSDKAQGGKGLEIAMLLPELFLNGDTASLALNNIPAFFRKNQDLAAKMLPRLMPILIERMEKEAEAAALLYDPSLDKAALKKIMAPAAELLKAVDQDLVQKLIPVIVLLIDGVTTSVSPEDLRSIYQNVKILTAEDATPEDKAAAQQKLIAAALKVASAEKMTEALRELGGFVSNPENIPAITTIATQVIESNPGLKALSLPHSLVESTIPLVAALANSALASGGELTSIATDFLKYRAAAQGSDEWRDSLVSIMAAGSRALESLSPMLRDNLPLYLNENNQDLAELVSARVVAAKPFTEVMPAVIGLISNALPLAVDGAVVLLPKSAALVEIVRDFGDYQFQGKQLEAENLEEEARADLQQSQAVLFNGLIDQGLRLVSSEEVMELLQTGIPQFLTGNQEQITELAAKAMEDPALNRFGVSQELVKQATPLVAEAAAGLLSHTPELVNITKNFRHYQLRVRQLEEVGLEEGKRADLQASQDDLFNGLIDQGLSLVNSEEIMPFLQVGIPKLLTDNQEEITKLFIDNTGIINRLGVSKELAEDMVPFGMNLVATLLSHAPEITGIAQEVHKLILAKEKERPQKVATLVDSILALKNNNADINDLIENKAPELLAKHSEELGQVLDKLLTQTEGGKAFRARGRQIVDVVSKNFLEVEELAESYAKGKRASLIPKALKLLFNKEVLSLVVGVIGDTIRHKFQRSVKPEVAPTKVDIKDTEQNPAAQLSQESKKNMDEIVGQLQVSGAVVNPDYVAPAPALSSRGSKIIQL